MATSKLRSSIWPIFGKEHIKFIPLTLMISAILFNYTIVRNMKDALVVTSAGSEILTFIKVWGVLPAAVITFLVYSKLANILKRQTLFYSTVLFFLGFFALFALVLYPFSDVIHPTQSAQYLHETMPAAFKHFINMYQYWSFALFYIMAELWGSVVSALLFWQFANGIVKVSEAKRFYGHFYLLANFAVSYSGVVGKYYSKLGLDNYGITVDYTMLTVVVCGFFVMGCYYFVDKFVIPNPELVDPSEAAPRKKKLKLSMGESIKFIMSSRYLMWIAILVISYGISINLVEVAWKNQLKMLFPTKPEYNAFMNQFTQIGGLVTVAVILFGGALLRALGWRVGALATPVIIGITGAAFFFFLIFNHSIDPMVSALGTTALVFAVMSGAIQNIASKSTKYALFDPTKEMAYIPLDEESKVKGKAAVDVVGARFGKAGGSILQQAMFMFIGPVMVIAPYSAAIMLLIVFIWIIAVYKLYDMFVAAGGQAAWEAKMSKK